ncbi:Rap1a/Tai family immunity protein [uncultured Sphingomonas sp.]|uniref:Rap1a/Tai family immunity protein n=1 Tax=uncultured Sphingomonas sp. TaxID=158754 RepID=UPI0025EAAE22|nr:Rap1a/Tai family immunity protein [uncultured Sphingomonas sp.]
MVSSAAILLSLVSMPVQSAPAAAQATESSVAGGLFTANQLRDRCNASSAADISYCFAYVTGVHDSARAYEVWLGKREFCAPPRIPQGELRHAFLDYLTEHPGNGPAAAASVVVVAFKLRFPCEADAKPEPAR